MNPRCTEQGCDFLIKFTDLFVDESQFRQHHVKNTPVDGMESRGGTERVA